METHGLKRYTFRKRERLRLRRDISLVFRFGKAIQSENFVVLYKKNGLDYSRLAIIVKRKFGKANRRNKLRRWIRECFRLNKDIIPKGYDFIVIARRALSEKFENSSYKSVCESLLENFERLIDAESNTGSY
ncbi:ribonuclease P protein component [Fervidobacterium changbaicum]|uniref:Ribonuclease P protein component n=2 Tax=Fervidobacterium TaxID=2422 RepID=A0AAI8CM14_FERIS|nr:MULTISPECIES: ribonuclease P protein component [Fervidobacterium]AMW32897.1 ribonuclease P protein component [Fervidobacterium islandicum]QAV32936.1 ribonuclease P protein component [Fervidobacterium changbaicum]SDH47695.1 ribonuclease P protein component [Fervidobacterium changbaicum]